MSIYDSINVRISVLHRTLLHLLHLFHCSYSSRHCNVLHETNTGFQNSFIPVCQLLWTSLKPHPLQDVCVCSYRDNSFIRVARSAQHHCRTQGKMKHWYSLVMQHKAHVSQKVAILPYTKCWLLAGQYNDIHYDKDKQICQYINCILLMLSTDGMACSILYCRW